MRRRNALIGLLDGVRFARQTHTRKSEVQNFGTSKIKFQGAAASPDVPAAARRRQRLVVDTARVAPLRAEPQIRSALRGDALTAPARQPARSGPAASGSRATCPGRR